MVVASVETTLTLLQKPVEVLLFNSFESNPSKTLNIYKILLTDQSFKQKRDSALKKLIDKSNNILSVIDSVYDKSYAVVLDKNEYYMDVKIAEYKSILKHNLKRISDYLSYNNLFVNFCLKDSSYRILNESYVPISLNTGAESYMLSPITLEFNDNNLFLNYSIDTIYPKDGAFDSEKFHNVITKNKIPKHDIVFNKIQY